MFKIGDKVIWDPTDNRGFFGRPHLEHGQIYTIHTIVSCGTRVYLKEVGCFQYATTRFILAPAVKINGYRSFVKEHNL